MLVKELIEKLKKHNQESSVYIWITLDTFEEMERDMSDVAAWDTQIVQWMKPDGSRDMVGAFLTPTKCIMS